MLKEGEQFTLDEWNAMRPEEQEDYLENNPESIPDTVRESANSPQGNEEDNQDDDSNEDNEDVKTVVYKGKEIPIENLTGEAVRKATGPLKEELAELKQSLKIKEEVQSATKQPQNQGKDPWQSKAEEISKRMIKYDDETGDYTVDPTAVQELLKTQAMLHQDIRGLERDREKEIETVVNTLTGEEQKVLGKSVKEELHSIPLGQDITQGDVDKAITMAKGRKADALVEEAKRSLEKKVNRGNRKIEGEDVGDDSYVPGSKSSQTKGKKPTARQKQMADERGISYEAQIKLDEKHEKKK